MPDDTKEKWDNIACRFCRQHISVKDLAEHEAECAKKEHPAEDRFE